MSHPTNHGASISVSEEEGIVALQISHAVYDGGQLKIMFSDLNAHPNCPDCTVPATEVFSKQIEDARQKIATNPNLFQPPNHLLYSWSHAPAFFPWRESAHARFPFDKLKFVKNGKASRVLENEWASMIVGTLAHNWRKTGAIDLQKSGIVTVVNMRPFIPETAYANADGRRIANAWGMVTANGGAMALEEPLSAITNRMRTSLLEQYNSPQLFYGLTQDFTDCVRSTVPYSPQAVSSVGTVKFAKGITDFMIYHDWRNITTEVGQIVTKLFTLDFTASGLPLETLVETMYSRAMHSPEDCKAEMAQRCHYL
jgi:hypothetical protein